LLVIIIIYCKSYRHCELCS